MNIEYDVQSFSHVKLFVTSWTAACQASLSITNSHSLLKLMSIKSLIPSNHLILCHPLLLPSIFSSIRVFSKESVLCIRWPKYWSFSFSISPSNEYSGLISFRIDWLDLLAVQETLKSLLQHHSSKKTNYLYDVILLAVGLSYTAFISLRYVPSTPILLSIFNHKCWIFVKSFFCIYWDDHTIFIIQFVKVYHIDLWMLNHPCVSGITPIWFWYVILLLYC